MSGQPATQSNVRGAALLTAAAFLFTGEVTVLRYIDDATTSGQVVMFRAAAQLIVASLWIASEGGLSGLRTTRPMLHVIRGLVSLVCWLFYYLSFRYLDMALATVLTFSTSLFVVAVAGPLLGERVGTARWVATILGFAGVVLVTGLGTVGFEPAVILGILAAAGGAAIAILNRILARTESTSSIMFYIGLVTLPGTLPFALLDWQPMSLHVFALGAVMGLFGGIGMWFTIEAYRVGEVSALAPIPYLRIIFAVAVGVLLFDELPAWTTVVGAVIIILSAVMVARHERQRTGLAAPHR